MATNPQNTPPNIVGEPFKEYVNGQIRVRQQSHGSGFDQTNRSEKDLVYLNSRNAWIKMASSVMVLDEEGGEKKLKELDLDINFKGDQLAKKAVLFNGVTEFGNKTQPGGVASNNSIFNNSAYGFGGSKYGIQPMPGITDFTIGHNNIGSIRTATVNIRAHSPTQFGIINLLYIRLGYSMLIEWGNSLYLDNNGKLQKMGPTLIDEVWFDSKGITPNEFNIKTEEKRKQYNGNYDGFFGKVVNFEYKFNPDGSYDIELKLISQGDVIESFKLDVLTPEYLLLDRGEITNINDLDNNNVLNSLYCFKNTLSETLLLSSIISNEQGDLEEEKDEKYGVLASRGQNIVNPYSKKPGDFSINPLYKEGFGRIPSGFFYDRYYIRFGFFLEFLKSLLPENKCQEKIYPSLEFNTSLKNYSKNYKELISFNPDICFINNGFEDETFKNFKSYKVDGNPFIGTLLNIYIEGEFIHNTIKNIIDREGKLTVFNLLKAICDGINTSLANVTALYPTLQDDYMVVIRDANLDVRTGAEGEILEEEKISETFELFGYNTSKDTTQSNFIKDFDFTTTISKDLASMISIGATAGNTDVSEYSEFFKNLNDGLEDRYKTANTSQIKDKNLSDVCKRESSKPTSEVYVPSIGRNLAGSGGFQPPERSKPKSKTPQKEKELTAEEKDIKLRNEYNKWFDKTLSIREENFNYVIPVAAQRYFATPEDGEINWSKGKQLFSTIIKNKYLVPNNNLPKNSTSSNIGFIPMGVDLTLDGLGGMKVYNQLKVNSLHLPVGYPDELELVIIGIDHQIQNNSWITKVRTYTKPTSQPWGVELDSSIIDERARSAFAEEEITTFTTDDPNDDINRLGFGSDPIRTYSISPTAQYLKNEQQQNGFLDSKYLTNVGEGFFLAKTAAEFFKKWMLELARENQLVTLTSAYRDLKTQKSLSSTNTEPGRVAFQGTSAHGWGGAVDLSPFSKEAGSTSPEANLIVRQSPLWRRVAAIGAKYGWYNPTRLSDGNKPTATIPNVDEAWHFEYWGSEKAKITDGILGQTLIFTG